MPRRTQVELGEWRERDDLPCRLIEADSVQERVQQFYPERSHVEAAKAKAACKKCPVRQECLDEAIKNGERFGVWGGMDTLERQREARRRRELSRST